MIPDSLASSGKEKGKVPILSTAEKKAFSKALWDLPILIRKKKEKSA